MSTNKKSNVKEIITNFVNYISQKKKLNSNKLQLLEPLTSVIRLAMLHFVQPGTKIAIYNNRIYHQIPNALQGTIRWTYGNKRNELHNLYRPIVVCSSKYNLEESNNINIIFNYAIKGLNNLKNTYSTDNSDIVCHSINLYKEILQKKEQTIDKFDINIDDITIKLYDKFRLLWNDEQIQIIAFLLKQAEENIDSKYSFLDAIDCILKKKEEMSIDIINNFTKNITS